MNTTIIAQAFNQNPSAAKRAAKLGPVVITEHGRKTPVLMSFEAFSEFSQNAAPRRTLLDLAYPESETLDLEIDRGGDFGREIEL